MQPKTLWQTVSYYSRHLLLVIFFLLPALTTHAEVRLVIEPDNSALRNNIEAWLGEVQQRNTREMRRYARYARGQVVNALEALGYYNYQLRLEVEEGEPARLLINLQPGERIRLGEVRVELTGEASTQQGFAPPPQDALQSGQPLDHGVYEATKRFFRNQALRYGYFSARFEQQQLLIHPEQGTADIHLHFESGPRYHFGEIRFDHEGLLREEFLRSYVMFAPGSPYSTDQLTELSRDLRASGYFNEVLVDARQDEADENLQVPVNILLRVREPRSLAAGVGYSTDIGPRVSGSWTQYRINRRGHSRGVDAEVSEPRQLASVWYQWPLNPPMTDKLRLIGHTQQQQFDDQESLRYGAGIYWHHRQDSGWDRVLSLRGEREDFRIGQDKSATWLTLPGVGFGKLQSDQRVDPGKGYRLQIDLTGSREDLLADVDILQLTFFSRGLITLRQHHRLLARLQVGALATNEFNRVPVSLRFFAGGDQSVRGYGYQELSPTDASGQLTGGRYLLTGGVEYQYALTDRWRVATFVDAGDAVAVLDQLSEPKIGVGIGLRWVSPVGPLRLDLAQGLDDQVGGWRLHFSMGPEL
ncbi:MAG: outer membrane protein assembly factor [Marinospirillum sp.]|uniref:autotransporter assembly complex protein TamA n=1 Tax=Marinospirillum sp. TaxID=2183934 RepID=UPI0019F591FE|nr:autotransporter assembly complex family protein [Marinospirillum sp.]MBE0506778.1 outer membrane protein assembly factor [Marinospirillum sp.]